MIFVNMACYRDPEFIPTIHDMFAKARHPDQIRIGLVLQSLPSDGLGIEHPQVRVRHVHAAQARGPCWARAQAQRLWDGEDHVLQIDSHMRFARDWDARMLAQLAACASPRPLLTTYPPGYEPPDTLNSISPVFLAPKSFDGRGMLVQQGLIEAAPPRPKPTAVIAAGFLFGRAEWMHDAPYDPELYFHGEEATLALRLWTHGWDFFGPTEALIWHYYGKSARPLHWEDDPHWGRFDTVSLARVRRVLGMAPMAEDGMVAIAGFGPGSVRTRKQYRRFSGIDYRALSIAQHATQGLFYLDDDPPPDDAGMVLRLGRARIHRAAWPVYA